MKIRIRRSLVPVTIEMTRWMKKKTDNIGSEGGEHQSELKKGPSCKGQYAAKAAEVYPCFVGKENPDTAEAGKHDRGENIAPAPGL